MTTKSGLHVDQSELVEAVQAFKADIDRFVNVRLWLMAEDGEKLGSTGLQSLAKQNPEVGAILEAVIRLADTLGGQVAIEGQEDDTPLKDLGLCGEKQVRYGEPDLLCSLPVGHDEEMGHSWE